MPTNTFTETLAAVASEFGVENTEKHGNSIKRSKRPYFKWTDEQLEQLTTLRSEGKSAVEIAETLGVSRDKVISKLAAMAARERADTDREPVQEPVEQSKSEQATEAEAEPEQEVAPEPSTEAEPELVAEPVEQEPESSDDLDRLVFAAFTELVGKVDDYNKMSLCWRDGLEKIEHHIGAMSHIARRYPETEKHISAIAAIVAYECLVRDHAAVFSA